MLVDQTGKPVVNRSVNRRIRGLFLRGKVIVVGLAAFIAALAAFLGNLGKIRETFGGSEPASTPRTSEELQTAVASIAEKKPSKLDSTAVGSTHSGPSAALEVSAKIDVRFRDGGMRTFSEIGYVPRRGGEARQRLEMYIERPEASGSFSSSTLRQFPLGNIHSIRFGPMGRDKKAAYVEIHLTLTDGETLTGWHYTSRSFSLSRKAFKAPEIHEFRNINEIVLSH